MALGRLAPRRIVRTYWLGRSTPFGLSTVARIRNVPVCELYDGSANVILPVYGNIEPSTSSISTMNWRSAGSFRSPFCTSPRMRSISFSETLKLIHIGVSTDTVVSWLFCGLTYVPSATAAKLLTPSTGETIVQYERSSCADSSCAFDWATAAADCSYWPCASSRSFCDSAFCCASGLVRARFACATSIAA